ncbi:unnamed protein product [Caenorhabditis bovis]|uniref:Uncharacterized protein n=1 Tax=Caenorhabditis bovis TaxID=2654633 RepID=A0A8S1FBD2_9PELO|nr:unnamed protein product [Caenorhabditis bovis]
MNSTQDPAEALLQDNTTVLSDNSTLNNGTHEYYTFFSGTAEFLMCSYVYFIPRIIAYRCVTIADDKMKAHFWSMTYLIINNVCLSIANICKCFNFVSDPTPLTIIFWLSTAGVFHQLTTHIVTFISLQQLAQSESFSFSHLFLEGPCQHVYVLVLLFVYAIYNFWDYAFYFGDNDFDIDKVLFKSNIAQEIVFPLITFLIYNYVRLKTRKERYYAQQNENYDGTKPTTLDQTGKIAWFQGVMALVQIITRVYIHRFDAIEESDFIKFIVYCQSPTLSCIVFVSILRKKRPTRPCFLLCCTEDNAIPQSTSVSRVGASG